MEAEELQEGKRYLVKWDDCCTAGNFVSNVHKLGRISEEEARSSDDVGFLEEVTFDNGVTLMNPLWGVKFEELTDAT